MPLMQFVGNLGYVAGNNPRWISAIKEDNRSRSYPVILTVCKKLQPTDHTVSTGR